MKRETFDEYRGRFPGAAPLTADEVKALEPALLDRLRGGPVTDDERLEALAWLAYVRCDKGSRPPAPAVTAILSELVADPEPTTTTPQVNEQGLRLDGPSFEEFVSKGYAPETYPPQGWAAKESAGWTEYQQQSGSSTEKNPLEDAGAGAASAESPSGDSQTGEAQPPVPPPAAGGAAEGESAPASPEASAPVDASASAPPTPPPTPPAAGGGQATPGRQSSKPPKKEK